MRRMTAGTAAALAAVLLLAGRCLGDLTFQECVDDSLAQTSLFPETWLISSSTPLTREPAFVKVCPICEDLNV